MAKPYDPLDFDTWPPEQKEFAGRVVTGLANGDAKPLAEYIRAGHYLEPVMAAEIADMIEGAEDAWFHFKLKARRRGQRGWSEVIEAHDRKMAVGVFVETRLRGLPRGAYAQVVFEAGEKFELGATAVAEALAYVRQYIAEADVAPGYDLLEELSAFYSAR
jgi:hypothetical protein